MLSYAKPRRLFDHVGPVDVGLVVEALVEDRVGRALAHAKFDVKVRREWQEARAGGHLVGEVEVMMASRYHCSVETIRTIIYFKRRGQNRRG